MDHAVTVGTDEDQIVKAGCPGSRYVQRDGVVALDVAGTADTVGPLEVEAAHATGQVLTQSPHTLDLLSFQSRVSLAHEMPTHQQAALVGPRVVVICCDGGRQPVEVTGFRCRADRPS